MGWVVSSFRVWNLSWYSIICAFSINKPWEVQKEKKTESQSTFTHIGFPSIHFRIEIYLNACFFTSVGDQIPNAN